MVQKIFMVVTCLSTMYGKDYMIYKIIKFITLEWRVM